MLKTTLLHPEILYTLGTSGHGSKVLIADGNYPFGTHTNAAADHVYLNLAPGKLTVTDVLEVLVSAIPIEAAEVMTKPGAEPEIFVDFRRLLPADLTLQPVERFAFYDAASHPHVSLVIATGEQRLYANILLTIGVVPPA